MTAYTNTELAKLAVEGYQDEQEELLRRDADLRGLYVAWERATAAATEVRISADPPNWFDALTAEPAVEVQALYAAYLARLKQIAAGE